MKKILFLIFLTISTSCFSQKKLETNYSIVDSVSKIIKKHVVFVSWYQDNDTIKITQVSFYETKEKKYVDLYLEDIRKQYPILLNLFTTKIQLPPSSSNRSNINNIDTVNSVNF